MSAPAHETCVLRASDFAIFDVPGYYDRMPLLRGRLIPLMMRLGDRLAPRLREATGRDLYPRAARHLRRTANAPDETWVAFGPSRRAYKPFAHFRVTLGSPGVDVVVFLEWYADAKPAFAARLAERADLLAAHAVANPDLQSYDMQDASGRPLRGEALDAAAFRHLAGRLCRLQKQDAVFGFPIAADAVADVDEAPLLDLLTDRLARLDPLYACGLPATCPPA